MYRSTPSFTLYAQTRTQILSQTELEQTSCYPRVRKYRSLNLLNVHCRNLARTNWRFAPCNEEMLIGLEFKSTRIIRQRHSHAGIICLRGGGKAASASSVFVYARIGVPTLPPWGRGHGFAPRFPAIPLPRFAFPSSSRTHVSRGVCNLCASDNPRSGR